MLAPPKTTWFIYKHTKKHVLSTYCSLPQTHTQHTDTHISATGVSSWAQCLTQTVWQKKKKHDCTLIFKHWLPRSWFWTVYHISVYYSRVACWSACKCADSILCLFSCCHTTGTREMSDPLKRKAQRWINFAKKSRVLCLSFPPTGGLNT